MKFTVQHVLSLGVTTYNKSSENTVFKGLWRPRLHSQKLCSTEKLTNWCSMSLLILSWNWYCVFHYVITAKMLF